MYKAIFFDIDGTLISFKTHTMPTTTLEALKKLREKGIKLFVATGRPKMAAMFIEDYFKFDGYITLNGQYCFNESEVIHKKSINKNEIKNLVNLLKTNPFPCTFIEENRMYINYIDDKVKEHCKMTNQQLPKIGNVEEALKNDIYQFLAYLDEDQKSILIDNVKEIIPNRAVNICMDVAPAGGGKVVGIDAILNYYKISLNETIAFGDGRNDIEMLKHVNLGIAVGNSSDEVKKNADYVTTDIENDGIKKSLVDLKIID
ncbi:MAG: Cof-type HAD-IIB family hydrolase [Clostridia bacterium]|nr:Cof-type HAD-IIB family hydrolase [Clostridia bacterium]